MVLNDERLREGLEFLARRDGKLAALLIDLGPPPIWAREPGFATLLHIILEQQVSLQSARAAFERLLEALDPITPERFLTLGDEHLKQIGFSRQKTSYGRALARSIVEGALDLGSLESMNDQQVAYELMKVKGIGRWTADIYLLMALGRADVWPAGDLALQVAVERIHNLKRRPTSQELNEVSRGWRPWRAVAARLLWHYYLTCEKPRGPRRASA
jgi:DNA-3-methyladenine glycosylase II